jgi:two-component system CheB/CheR fusion protein
VGDHPLFVVALGSSAGGLEALRSVMYNLPPAADFAYIVAQHLSPQHSSLLPELLSRETSLRVTEIKDGTAITRNSVFVTPPNHDVIVVNGQLRLTAPGYRGPKPSVDNLLISLAEHYGSRAIAVILSGTGSDGARGVRAIKAKGGYVIVQDPRSAKYPSMPEAARQTGCVDQVVPPEQIGPRLHSLFKSGVLEPRDVRRTNVSETDRILEKIAQSTNIDFRGYKLKTLSRRIHQRMASYRLTRLSDYLTLLETEPDEVARLAQSCLISVTSFFRDPPAFEALAKVISEHFGQSQQEPLRVWVPGCATGEEVYTLAILFDQHLPGRRVQIFGTDIDDRALAAARKAIYTPAQLRGLPAGVQETYFRRTNSGYLLLKPIRDRVVFARHDLLRDPLFLNLDLISCRNLLIYLKSPAQEEVLRKFHLALKPSGILFLGKSENAPTDGFDPIDRRLKIFVNKQLLPGEKKLIASRDWPYALEGAVESPSRLSPHADTLRQILLANFAPAAVLVDSNFRILDSYGDVGRYLSLKPGKPELTLLAMAPKSLAASLRAQLHRTHRMGTPSRGVPKLTELHGTRVLLHTTVHPTANAVTGEPLFVVSFFESTAARSRYSDAESASQSSSDEYVRELERELTTTRENLQSVVEELETSNEELQALNEELQSANEELHASNEELQASNEELQSANEELVTVNEELEHKSAESALLVEDLENIQDSIDSPLVIIDPSGNLRHANQSAIRQFDISPQQFGVPFAISDAPVITAQITARLQKVLSKGEPLELKVRWRRRHYRIRIRPYHTRDKKLRGAVVLFHDVTDLAHQAERLKRAEVALRLINARQEAAINALPVHIAMIDAKGVITAVNAAWRRFARENGYTGRRFGVGTNYLSICDRAGGPGSEGAAEMAEGIRRVISGESNLYQFEYPCPKADQTPRYFRCIVAPVSDALFRGAIIMHMDVTEQTLLLDSIRRQATALQSTANAVFITDAEGNIDWVNEAFERLTGYTAAEVLGKRPDSLDLVNDDNNFLDLLQSIRESGIPWVGEVTGRHREGHLFTLQQVVTPIASRSGEFSHFVFSHQDITHHKQAQERMLYMAEHDELTGLWNRKTFCDRLAEAIERHRRLGGKLAVLFLDLDRFKDTNDTLGHLVGDQMLLEIGRRLKQNLRESDVLARFGGDEFVIMIEDTGDRENISFIVERILHSFNRPLEFGGRSLFVSASIGITMYPDDGESAEELLRNSDLAMYRAKAEGRRAYRFYDQKLESEINERVSVERELNRALGSKDLWVAFQPQWDLRQNRLTGAECLLRWEGSSRHRIGVGRVIAIAEECGMILPIGQWVIQESLAHLERWYRLGYPVRLSINLSAVQFHHQDVFAIITEALAARGLPASAIKAEITESVLLHRSVRVKETLHALHGAGIGLILDDFGTGYSSLTYLQQFPIEAVKIDASFLQGIGIQKNDEAIVAGIIQMAHSLGQTVIAEGVETEQQLQFLKECGCDCGQGFLYSHPLTASEFEAFLAARLEPTPPPPPNKRHAIAGRRR